MQFQNIYSQFIMRQIGGETECDISKPPTNNSAYIGNGIDCCWKPKNSNVGFEKIAISTFGP
jgi:hypothetical protein